MPRRVMQAQGVGSGRRRAPMVVVTWSKSELADRNGRFDVDNPFPDAIAVLDEAGISAQVAIGGELASNRPPDEVEQALRATPPKP